MIKKSSFEFGEMYRRQRKYKEAEKYYKDEVKKGSRNAMCMLGYIFHVQKRYKEAEEWYKKACEFGSLAAPFFLKSLYFDCYRDSQFLLYSTK